MDGGTLLGLRIDAPSEALKTRFIVAVSLMFLHKIECWLTDEWIESPFFQSLVHSAYWAGMEPDAIVGEAIFLTFIFWLFCGLVMGWLVLRGGMWPTLALGIWGLTYILEFHHLGRTWRAGGYYPGIFTAIAYLGYGYAFYLPEWLRHIHRASPGSAGTA
ncbi:MAG: hypothetical protein H6737_30615 [Alphaproteobacteria bacterium]|nr:hypothetical protein [Alphaproteobacteria bacterium]